MSSLVQCCSLETTNPRLYSGMWYRPSPGLELTPPGSCLALQGIGGLALPTGL